jgi:hypothetical protein
LSLDLEEAQLCKRAMHFWRIKGSGFCGRVDEERFVLGL